jgi:hypothetical protein
MALAGRQDARLGVLLPFGTPEVVHRLLDQVLERADPPECRRLARFHPGLIAQRLRLQAESDLTSSEDADDRAPGTQAEDGLDPRLLWQVNAALPVLARASPDDGIKLAQSLIDRVSLGQLQLQELADRRPVEMADLALRVDDDVAFSLDRVAHRLDTERLLALLTRRLNTVRDYGRWFKRLSPERRDEVYAACWRGWQSYDGVVERDLVALLPGSRREQEGRRHLALPALATRPDDRLPYAAFLPWEEAGELLDPHTRDPDADRRSLALETLVFAVRYHREHLSELLKLLRGRSNEQDPVRGSMLGGLAGLPPGMWQAEHREDLGHILRAALDAPDLSAGTAACAEQLILNLLPFHPAWSSAWLATLLRERGQISNSCFPDQMTDREVQQIASDLLPVLQSWETREREGQLVSLAASLGRRLPALDALVEMLERIVRGTPNIWIAERALGLLAEHCPDQFRSLATQLIRQDPSWVTRGVVHSFLHAWRQDLLTPLLGQRAYRGRFSTGKTRFVLPFRSGFHRWTPAQQSVFAETLVQITRDHERDTPAVLGAIDQLAALPAVPPARLIELAGRGKAVPVVRDAALQALGRLDAGQGIPMLLEALGDSRARIAIYALRRTLLELPEDRAIGLLRRVPMEKVTVAKETIRLLGELSSEAAYHELLSLDGRDLHRDVRVALLRALWNHLEQPGTWEILQRAAASSDPALAASVARVPAQRLSPDASRNLARLVSTLLEHPEPTVRLAALERCKELPFRDSEKVLLSGLLAAVGSPYRDEANAAIHALFILCTGREAHLIQPAIERLMGKRRSVEEMVDGLIATLWGRRIQMLPTVRLALEVMARDPLTALLRVKLATDALPWDELASLLNRMADSGELHAEALMVAANEISWAIRRSDAAEAIRLEMALAARPDERLRRLAFAALVAQARTLSGWNEERLDRLRAFRSDPSPLVAAAAQFTWTPDEEQGGTKE